MLLKVELTPACEGGTSLMGHTTMETIQTEETGRSVGLVSRPGSDERKNEKEAERVEARGGARTTAKMHKVLGENESLDGENESLDGEVVEEEEERTRRGQSRKWTFDGWRGGGRGS